MTNPKAETAAMNTADAAAYTGMSVPWLKLARNSGHKDAPPFVRIGRSVRYLKSDLDRWLEERRRMPSRERPDARFA
jgi:predicted DNA-binding transcriptional regulator AlpA